MAAPTSSPSGFSYAQAAKGRASAPTSQPPSSKVTSGTATPAVGLSAEVAAASSWADDVENTVSRKAAEASKAVRAETVSTPVESTADADTKPDQPVALPAKVEPAAAKAASESLANPEEAVLLPNGTDHEVSEVKTPDSSEPAWIAERKERQTSSHSNEASSKGDKRSKESSPTPAPKLQDAPPPPVNPWMKRMEDNKAKSAQQPVPVKSSPQPVIPESAKETPKPRGDAKKKPTSNGVSPRESTRASTEQKQPDVSQKRSSDARPVRRQDEGTQTAPFSRPASTFAPPPSVQDAVSWPTPDTAAEKERRDSEKEASASKQPQTDEIAQAAKARKPEWKAMPVTPNYIFETQNIRGRDAPRGSERGGRGGTRGRNAGIRGGGTSNVGDRSARLRDEAGQRGRTDVAEQDASTPPARASSVGSWNDQNKESRPERSARGQSVAEARPGKKKPVDADAIALPLLDGKRGKAVKTSNDTQSGKSVEQEQHARRSSIGTQTEESAPVAPEAQPVRTTPSDNRRELRNENGRDPNFVPTGRGSGKRGGRGRGGNREQINGHHPSGQQPEFGVPFGMPPSPSMHGRGNHFGYGRGNWARNGPRSQSIPFDAYYGRYPTPYGHAQLPPVQTVMPGAYEYGAYPMTAVPYQPFMDTQYLVDMVSTQLEYYFSIDNLLKDMFLRKNMDSQGFVLLDVIANFNRIKQLTQDKEILKIVCINSENIEIRVGEDQKERLRRRDGWNRFLLPIDQRDPGAQNEGPQHLMRPDRPQMQTYGVPPYRGPSSAAPQLQQRGDRRSYDASLAMMGGFQQPFIYGNAMDGQFGDLNGGDASRGRSAKSSAHDQSQPFVPLGPDDKDGEADAFPDDQASTLTVVVKVNKPPRSSVHSHAARTFSNGSIDSRSIFTEMGKKPIDTVAGSLVNGETPNGTERTPSPNKDRSTTADAEISLFWMKDQSLPSEALPSDVTLEPYEALRFKALEQRSQAATGTCPYDMDVLYQFWCHFLIRNFNSRMYSEFKFFAHEDANSRHNLTGLQNLVKFYAQTLLSLNATRDRLVRDYVELVKDEPAQLENAAFKQLRSAWRNGALNLKNRKKLNDLIDSTLKERLES